MRIYVVPMRVSGFSQYNVAVRVRAGESPALFMQNTQIMCSSRNSKTGYGYHGLSSIAGISIFGEYQDGVELKDGDCLFIQMKNSLLNESFVVNLERTNGTYLTKGVQFDSISIAACMEEKLCVCITDVINKNVVSTAEQIFNKAMDLYSQFPSYRNIMLKNSKGETEDISLVKLVTTQEPSFIKWAETMLLSMDAKYKTQFPVAKQILEQSKTEGGFNLLSQEEQVAAFLEFSKRNADKAVEAVPDSVIDYLKESQPYQKSIIKLKQAGLGESWTQQFNVLQQVGYFGGSMNGIQNRRVIYNLSDMGAGKTLMTVQAIYVLDCVMLDAWATRAKNEHVEVESVHLPNKHIIAPTLSVKASWVDTFKLFYDVEEVDDCYYKLKTVFGEYEAESELFIAPFSVKGGKVYVQQKLPKPECDDTYLIIDEIHQLVRRRIARTKFLSSGIVPVTHYRVFALSGTMSNLKAGEWLSLIRFLGDTDILESAANAKTNIETMDAIYKRDVGDVAAALEMLQHKKFNIDDVSEENRYKPTVKKKPAIEIDYFMHYGSKIFVPGKWAPGHSVQDVLSNKQYEIVVEPEESDNVSFELFYHIAATSAITAQSLQVAEELFGEQATQHKSSIIKTMSPFTDEEIKLLNTLHQIAADCGKYRSEGIGREINNAILNLNDGLQQKDLYSLVSGFAERNTRFLGYLASLDVNVLERLPKTSLIRSPKLMETHKFKVLKELLEKNKDETFLIVVNDFYAMKTLAEALGISYLSKAELKDEMAYQELLDALFEKQSVVIVTQNMIKSSLDLVQANRLVQYQLNTEVSDIIQTQNRINRIGQTRETRCYYIAADRLQNALIELFLDSYRNIRVAHKGIVELFADLSSQIDVINDYLNVAFKKLAAEGGTAELAAESAPGPAHESDTDLIDPVVIQRGRQIQETDGMCHAVLFPDKVGISVIVPLANGEPFCLGHLKPDLCGPFTKPQRAMWNLKEMKLMRA